MAKTPPKTRPYFLIGIVFFLILVLIVKFHHTRLQFGETLKIEAKITQNASANFLKNLVFDTPLNHIDTTQIAGDKYFKPGSKITVFLSPGPNDIWYPYAVAKKYRPGLCLKDNCLEIVGTVISSHAKILEIEYGFNQFYPNTNILEVLKSTPSRRGELTLSVQKNGQAFVRRLKIANSDFDQRQFPIPKVALPALIKKGARAAPAR